MALNFDKKLEKRTDKELRSWLNTQNSHFIALASDELMRRSIRKLEKTTEVFNNQSSKQTEKLIKLTWLIVSLTIVMVVGLVIQIILIL